MRAYIEVHQTDASARVQDAEWVATVVSEQDYYERGPWSCSHRTDPMPDAGMARDSAIEWAETHGYDIVTPDEI